MTSIDVYSNTNPALCAVIVHSFASGYTAVEPAGIDLPLAFLPVPLVLSRPLVESLDRTSVGTGLYTWLVRCPEVLIGLPDAVEAGSPYTSRGITFGIRYGLLTLSQESRIVPLPHPRIRSRASRIGGDVARAIRLSERLGIWLGRIGSTSSILYSLGMRP